MLTPSADFSIRRSVYSVLLILAVLGPAVTISWAVAGVRAHWIEVISGVAALVGIPLLCIWCAIYVQHEARLVRIALIWIAALFLFVLGKVLWHPYVH
jgi:uncharacterized membrane protein